MSHVVIVQWSDGRTELAKIPSTGQVTVGTGEPQDPVPMYDEHEHPIGALTVCGEDHPTWMVCHTFPEPNVYLRQVRQPLWDAPADDEPTQPEAVNVLELVSSDEVSENDARRIHALADLITALDLLAHLVESEMTRSQCWFQPGVMRAHVARARSCLQCILTNADYLIETRADRIDLQLAYRDLYRDLTGDKS